MPPHAPRLFSFVLVLVTTLSIAIPAMAQVDPAPSELFSPDTIVFPIDGPVEYTDSFGDPRAGHTHEGVDMMAEKGLPVLAAADGVVDWIGSDCCYFSIDHGGGWETWYIHLNNDTPETDDGAGCVTPVAPSCGIAPGIAVGTPVVAGQVIGWVGDSGNAEGSGSHLHYEIRQNGVALNPYPYVLAAEQRATGLSQDHFLDDNESVHQVDINRIYEEGLTLGCNPPGNTMYCPERPITRGEMAAFIRRLQDLPSVDTDHFVDDESSEFHDDINAVTSAGIGFGCSELAYCADDPLRREEMAEMLVRTFEYENPTAGNRFVDDEGNLFEVSINVLASVGVTKGCNPPENTLFCPTRALTRAEMASFFIRALDIVDPPATPEHGLMIG